MHKRVAVVVQVVILLCCFQPAHAEGIETIPRDERIKLVESDNMKILQMCIKEFEDFTKASSKDMKEYESRLAGLKEGDADGLCKLALWCKEKRLHREAYLALATAIKANPEHAEARKLLCWKKSENKWTRDYESCGAAVKYVESDAVEKANVGNKGFETAKNLVRDTSTYAAVFAEIEKQTGIFRAPWEIEIGVGFTDAYPGHVYAITRPLGWNETSGAYKLVVLVNVKYANAACAKGGVQSLTKTLVHEFVHVLCTPATLSWGPLLLEGIAAYVAADPPITMKNLGPADNIKDMDAPASSLPYAYARGSAFFAFYKKTYGDEPFREMAFNLIIKRQPLSTAASTAAKTAWEKLKSAELEYTKALKK